MDITKVADRIIRITCNDDKDLAKAMIRFQEYYESPDPDINGKVFTVGKLLNTQVDSTKLGSLNLYTGGRTYPTPNAGYNFPSYVLTKFIKGDFDPLTPAEADIVDCLKRFKGKFYVIGTSYESDSSVEKHELAHALFYLDPTYKEFCQDVMAELEEEYAPLCELLTKMHYPEKVFEDEAQAYLVADYEYLIREAQTENIDLKISPSISLKLQRAYYGALKRAGFSLKE